MRVISSAPASIGNVSVGFDILGAALSPVDGSSLGDRVIVEDGGREFELKCGGRFADKLPQDYRKNIVYDCYVDFKKSMEARSLKVKNLVMTLEKNLPVGTGLGSSACSVVAALDALNEFHGNPFSEREIMELMGKEEGKISGSVHYDNVAPCYLGGIQLMIGENGIISDRIPDFDSWYWVSCYPGTTVSTAEARAILPKQYDRHDCIDFGRQLATFIHASHTGNSTLAAAVLKDVIAEPYRRKLIANFSETREYVMKNGAIAMGISGSGPSIFVVTESMETAEKIQEWLLKNFVQNELGFSNICKIDRNGTVSVKE